MTDAVTATVRGASCALACLALAACGDFVTYDADSALDPPDGRVLDAGAGGDLFEVCAGELEAPPPAGEAAYGELLAARVELSNSGFALVDYAGWSDSADDMSTLDAYVEALAGASPEPCDVALWINAYNANVLQTVLERFEGDPGYSVSADDFAFFSERAHTVAGVTLSLDELEHGVLRGDFTHAGVVGSPQLSMLMSLHRELWRGALLDARIHMALNCAAQGCPNLRHEPWRGDALDDQLRQSTAAFLDNAVKGAGRNGLSQLFQWFERDFERYSGSVPDFVEQHRSAGLVGVELGTFIEYDWSLNTQ